MRCRRGQGQGLDLGWVGDLGWGGVGLGSWGWAFSFLCFGIVECAHGHAYAKQVRIMCVLSVPLLDQVQGVLKISSRTWSGPGPGTGPGPGPPGSGPGPGPGLGPGLGPGPGPISWTCPRPQVLDLVQETFFDENRRI